MDPTRFDRLAVAVAARPSRRGAAKALAGAALGGLLAPLGAREAAACRGAGRRCGRNRQCCPGICRRGRCRCGDGRRPCRFTCCTPGFACRNEECVARHCSDNRQNFDEADEDCGGVVCPPCDAGKRCRHDEDCRSGVCEGGTCRECREDGQCTVPPFDVCVGFECKQCRLDSECPPARRCVANRCERHCGNGRRDGNETDEDCGGDCVQDANARCGLDQGCRVDDDCRSRVCVDSRCRECRSQADCTNPPFLLCVDNLCVECEDDGDCGAVLPACVANRCRQCRTDADCPDGKSCLANVCEDGCLPGGQTCTAPSECCSRHCCGCLAEGFRCCPVGQRCQQADECVVCG